MSTDRGSVKSVMVPSYHEGEGSQIKIWLNAESWPVLREARFVGMG